MTATACRPCVRTGTRGARRTERTAETRRVREPFTVTPDVLRMHPGTCRIVGRPCYILGMAKPHALRCYDYVNHPYADVRDALRADIGGIFGRATKSATGRAHALVANLKVDLGALEIGTDVVIEVTSIEEREEGPVGRTRTTFIQLRWAAARSPALFPSMEAELIVYPLSKDETQLELQGRYTPPLGTVGSALDSLIGHRVADASVHRFVTDVASLLRDEIAAR